MRALASAAHLTDRPLRHALVLGGSGFIGAPLVRALRAAGVRTTCLVHRAAVPGEGVRGALETFRWRSLEADLPDVIFHLARIPGRGGLRGALTRVRNRLANERLLGWLMGNARPPLVVYVGGTLAYGSRGDEPVTEATPLSPISFARDYHDAEVPWLRALARNDAPVIVARPAWVLGDGSWFEAFYRRVMRRDRVVPLYGAGDNWMSLVHVADCAGLLLHLARAAPPMSSVNLFTGPPLRQRELTERLAGLSGLPVRPIPLATLEPAVREAFTFSARVATLHEALLAAYSSRYPDLHAALESCA